MNYELPTSVTVDGGEYEIRTDYRAILDICTALTDADLRDAEKAEVALSIFYPDFRNMRKKAYAEALQRLFWFLNMGEEQVEDKKRPKLIDWEQDFRYIIAPINKAAGTEVRSVPYMHWWTFMGYYAEIDGECTFAFIVQIRDKLKRGKKLDEAERRFYRENRNVVEFQKKYSDGEEDLIKKWTDNG